ncbi:hypothetical protein K438DRAFT_1781130 [Mycena galopus ATCC 62051]|nr:hypothetical protein K438DRAFT_1781130 [Mycena galopus ATCC 62051]
MSPVFGRQESSPHNEAFVAPESRVIKKFYLRRESKRDVLFPGKTNDGVKVFSQIDEDPSDVLRGGIFSLAKTKRRAVSPEPDLEVEVSAVGESGSLSPGLSCNPRLDPCHPGAESS